MKLDPHQDQSMRVELDDDVTGYAAIVPMLVCGVVTGIDPDAREITVWTGDVAVQMRVGDLLTINQQETRPRAGAFPPPPSKDTP